MFGRINSHHTLNQAILLKANNSQISQKTINKISEKLRNVAQKVLIETPMDPNNKALIKAYNEIKQINTTLQNVKSDAVYKQLSRLINTHLGDEVVNVSTADEERIKNKANVSAVESQTPATTAFNDAVFGTEEARRHLEPSVSNLLQQAVSEGHSEAVVLKGLAGTLSGHFHRGLAYTGNAEDTHPVVLYLHGSGTPVDHGTIATSLAYQLQGVDVLSVNMRGYGESEGAPSEEGLYQDARTMLAYLINDRGVAPEDIIIHGYAMGAPVAANLAKFAGQKGMSVSGLLLDRPVTGITKSSAVRNIASKAGAATSLNGQLSVEKNLQGLSHDCPVMLLTDCEKTGAEGEKLRTRLLASGLNVSGERTVYDHTQSSDLMREYSDTILSTLAKKSD